MSINSNETECDLTQIDNNVSIFVDTSTLTKDYSKLTIGHPSNNGTQFKEEADICTIEEWNKFVEELGLEDLNENEHVEQRYYYDPTDYKLFIR